VSLAAAVDVAYLHVDLDSLDPSHGRANEYAAPGGLDLDTTVELIDRVTTTMPVPIAAVAAYNPEVDDDGTMRTIGRAIARHIAQALGRR
jgi:arginase family enzyme